MVLIVFEEILTVILMIFVFIYAFIAVFWPIIGFALIVFYIIVCGINEARGGGNCWSKRDDHWDEDEEDDYFLGFIEVEEDN